MDFFQVWPIWLTYVITLALGLIFGSFLNVVIGRLPEGLSVVSPGSRCPSCETPIKWYDNIPVLSYLLLMGKCRKCKTHISIRYPVVELLTMILFLAVRMKFGWNLALFLREWPFILLLVAITFIDLDHRIIPDPLSLGGLVLGLATCWLSQDPTPLQAVMGAAVGFGSFYALAWVYQVSTGRSGLGGGDIKLLAMLGAFVGPKGVFITVMVSSILGSVVGIVWALVNRRKNIMKVSIPYGPFLVIGSLFYFLLGEMVHFG